MQTNTVLQGDCLELMPEIPDGAVDMILCDLPYGVTARNRWDSVIPPEPLWKEYRRVVKEDGAIVLTAQGAFSAMMIMAARDIYRYSLVWQKNKPRGFLNANRQPLRIHEDILVFYGRQPVFHPQKTAGHDPVHSYTKHSSDGDNYGETKVGWVGGGSTERYPTSIIEIPVVNNEHPRKMHPTQKPVELGEWLINTYTNPGDLVLDNACGSGSFLVAAKRLGRRFLGMEKDEGFWKFARDRVAGEMPD